MIKSSLILHEGTRRHRLDGMQWHHVEQLFDTRTWTSPRRQSPTASQPSSTRWHLRNGSCSRWFVQDPTYTHDCRTKTSVLPMVWPRFCVLRMVRCSQERWCLVETCCHECTCRCMSQTTADCHGQCVPPSSAVSPNSRRHDCDAFENSTYHRVDQWVASHSRQC